MRWEAAGLVAHEAVSPLEPRWVPLADAMGTTLAEPLVARSALPPFDVSAMDGYAVRGASPWRLVGTVLAGTGVAVLPPGCALRIATGAVVPAGCDGVLPYEQAQRAGALVHGQLNGRRHVRVTGEECGAGAELLPAGTVVTPVLRGLAAAVSHDELCVRPHPRVQLIVTGAELLTAGRPAAGQIRDALGPMLPGLLTGLGAAVTGVRHIADGDVATAEALAAVQGAADLVVTTGASAHGPADRLRPVLASLGARLLVDGVEVRPGHPMLLALLPGGPPVIGLPGNPLAAVCGLLTLVGPLLAGLAGRERGRFETARCTATLAAHSRDTRLLPVRVDRGGACPTGWDGPAMLAGLVRATALAVVRPGVPVAPGESVDLLPLSPR